MEENNAIKSFLKLASEYWRLLRAYERLMSEAPQSNQSRLKSTYRNSERKLSAILAEQKLKVLSYEGKEYTPNLAVTVINGDEFQDNENLIVSQMVEPTITQADKILSIGKAILRKKEGA